MVVTKYSLVNKSTYFFPHSPFGLMVKRDSTQVDNEYICNLKL